MHILCVTGYYKPAYVYGGPVRSVSALCEALVRAGAGVTVFTTNANGPGQFLEVPTGQPVKVDGVNVYYFPVSWPLASVRPFYAPALGQACYNHVSQFDAVYLPGSWTYAVFVGARAALQAKIPYVISPRGSFMDWSMNRQTIKKRLYLVLIERRLINKAAAIHTTTDLEQQQQEKWHFKPHVETIPNGLDPAFFTELPRRGKLRQSLGLSDGTLSLFVGRLHKEKRIRLMINAFATFAKQMPEAHLLIVGPDQNRSGQVIRRQARYLGLSSQVHFTGLLTGAELKQAYVDADLLVLVSHRESFGMVVVEAMAAGRPVLLTREVGLAREVEQAVAGFVVAPRPDEIGSAWQKLLSNPGLRQAMATRGKTLVRKRFSADKVAARMLALFTSVLARPERSR